MNAEPLECRRVAVIVLNWNGGETTLGCLRSLRLLDHQDVRTIVVDNGSIDDSVATIREQFPEVTLIQTGANLGYAGGNNAGIRVALDDAATRYLLLLNNDTHVHPRLVSEMVSIAEGSPGSEIYAPKIFYADRPDILWFAGGFWDAHGYDFFHRGDGVADHHQFDDAPDIDYASGCALFARREVVEHVGLLDERFFLMYEEADWCYRARKAGYRCRLAPRAMLWHKVSHSFGGAQSPRIAYFSYRNRLLWAEKHLPMRSRVQMFVHVMLELTLPSLRAFPQRRTPLSKRIYWLSRRRELFAVSRYRGIVYRSGLRGVRDYLLRRFGDRVAGHGAVK